LHTKLIPADSLRNCLLLLLLCFSEYTERSTKIAQSFMHRHFATVSVESHGFYQNAEKLTGNTKSGQILNIVIKCSLFGSW